MSIAEYLEAVQDAVNQYEAVCTQALADMKQTLVDARQAFVGDILSRPVGDTRKT
jgi:hypothetical protein